MLGIIEKLCILKNGSDHGGCRINFGIVEQDGVGETIPGEQSERC